MAHNEKKMTALNVEDGWSTVTKQADRARKKDKRQQHRQKYLEYCSNHWPAVRKAFAEAAEAKFRRFQPRKKPEGEDEEYDAEYTLRVKQAVQKACEKNMDCGQPVDKCRHDRCESNRRFYYEEWIKHAGDEIFVGEEVTYFDDDDTQLPEPKAPAKAKAKKVVKEEKPKDTKDFALNPFAALAMSFSDENDDSSDEGDETDDEVKAPTTPRDQIRTGTPPTPWAPRRPRNGGE
jgi:hypothetical protein